MRVLLAVLFSAFLMICLGIFTPQAKSGEWSKATVATFKQPVEIPGHVLLPGTYVFRLMNSPSDRHIVQVWTGDHKQCIATVLTETVKEAVPAPKDSFTFQPGVAKSPEEIKTWFYPGDLSGQEFYLPANFNSRARPL
jgi:hypothetical protein